MKRCLWMLLALVPVLLGASPTPADLDIGTYRALLIGVQDYADGSGIRDLSTPENDARALGTLLQERFGFDEVRVLTAERATRAGVLDALDQLRGESSPSDAVLVFFAGHGVWDEARDQGYWLPTDAVSDSRANWISNADLRDELGANPARHVLVISDACFSGSLIGTRDLGGAEAVGDLAAAQRLAGKRSRWVVASGGDEPVLDRHLSTGHSVFGYYLLQVLEEQRDPYVNLGSFLDTLQKRVVNNAPQTPIAAPLRYAGDEGGQLVLVNRTAELQGPREVVDIAPTGTFDLELEPPRQERARREPAQLDHGPFEAGLALGYGYDPYVHRTLGGLHVAYHLSSAFALEGSFRYALDLGQDDVKGVVGNMLIDAWESDSYDEHHVPISKVTTASSLALRWTPWRGRDLAPYASLGLAALGQQLYYATYDEHFGGSADSPVSLSESSSTWTIPVGVGLGAQWLFSERAAVTFDLRSYLWPDTEEDFYPAQANTLDTKLYIDVFATAGVVWYLGAGSG